MWFFFSFLFFIQLRVKSEKARAMDAFLILYNKKKKPARHMHVATHNEPPPRHHHHHQQQQQQQHPTQSPPPLLSSPPLLLIPWNSTPPAKKRIIGIDKWLSAAGQREWKRYRRTVTRLHPHAHTRARTRADCVLLWWGGCWGGWRGGSPLLCWMTAGLVCAAGLPPFLECRYVWRKDRRMVARMHARTARTHARTHLHSYSKLVCIGVIPRLAPLLA